MRENMGLYRGKRTDTDKWIYGSLLKIEIDGHTAWVIFGSEFQRDGKDVISKVHAHVDPDTVGEYVGTPDKNGKEIFEGDIVRLYGEDLPVWYRNGGVAEVKYNNFGFEPLCEYDCYCEGFVRPTDCEIIGTIHDNPELLGGNSP